MTRRVRRTQVANDDGSVLVMALIFLSIFGMLIAVVLGFAQTGFKTSTSGRTISAEMYAADGAVNTVINTRRTDLTFGGQGTDVAACFNMPASVNNTAVAVRCTGRAGSGVSTGGVGGGLTPANAVLTLPANATEGLVQTATSSALVSGNVLTNESRTSPAGSTLTVQGTLTCRTVSGTGTVSATTVNCPTAAPGGASPGYGAAIAARPANGVVPACAGATITFAPGTYTSVAALNALTGGACTNKTFNFSPGNYYFDFTDVGSHEWLINDATAAVVGGTMTASAFPNKCDLAAAGVQFVFGADSRVQVAAGSFELCPPLVAGQRIAVYGLTASTAPVAGSATIDTALVAASTGTTAYSLPVQSGAMTEAPTPAYTNVLVGASSNAMLNITGWSSPIPANATITGATLNVRHYQRFNTLPVAVRVYPGDASAMTSYPVTPCTDVCAPAALTSSISVLGALSTPAKANGIRVEYRVVTAAGQFIWSYVDGFQLVVTYTTPGLNASSGCIVVAPYNPASGLTCPIVRTSGGATSKAAIKGTIYAPLAPVNLSATGQLNSVSQRGIVARTLYLGMAPAGAYTGPLISMPGASDRKVLLTAAIGGVPKLRADVTYVDGLGATPGATVQITSWSVLR